MRTTQFVRGVVAPFVIGLLALYLGAAATANAQPGPSAANDCDRTCLNGFVDQYLAAIVAHDPSKLPHTATAKYSENNVVLELGDGILGDYHVGSFFQHPDLTRATRAVVMCANDLVAAWGAKKLMEEWGIPITVVSGPVTDNQTGTDYISRELLLPAANAKTDGRTLFGIVYEGLRKT